MNAVIEGYKQDTAYSKAAQDACKYKEGVAAGIAAVNKQHTEPKKQAHAAHVRRGVLQKKASKVQKRKQQNWDADITKDNSMYNTPKGSGSSSRSRTA